MSPSGLDTLPTSSTLAWVFHSLVGQENADVLFQAKKMGQVHGGGQISWCVCKLRR